jgi:hypothetical protein
MGRAPWQVNRVAGIQPFMAETLLLVGFEMCGTVRALISEKD